MPLITQTTSLEPSGTFSVIDYARAGVQVDVVPDPSGLMIEFEGTIDGINWVPARVRRQGDSVWSNSILVNTGDAFEIELAYFRTLRVASITGDEIIDATFQWEPRLFNLARQPQDFATLGGLGDSHLASGIVTNVGPDTQNLVTGRLGAMTEHNVLLWASGYSGAKLVYAGVEGTGGLTSQQIIDTHLAGAMRHRWTFCAISATTNDVGAVAAATTIANIEYMVVSLLSVGTIPIIMGNLPNRITTGAAYDALNIGLRKLATKYAQYGVIYEDAWSPYVGPDGLGKASLFRDNTHLTFTANRTRGQNLASLILEAHPWVRDAYLPYSNAAGKLGLATNPIFTANSGAVTPTGWTITGTGATSNVASGAVGNDWTLTRGSVDTSATTGTIAAAGGTYVWVGAIQKANGEFGFRDPGFVPARHAWRFTNTMAIPAGLKFAVKFAVPSGFPANYFRVLLTSAGTSIMSQFELYPTDPWV